MCYATHHPELNNNELNSLYVNNHDLSLRYVHEPELSARVSRRQCTAMRCVVDLVVCITGQAAADAAKILRRVVEGDVDIREQIPHVNLVDSTSQRLLSTRCAHDSEQNSTTRWADITH